MPRIRYNKLERGRARCTLKAGHKFPAPTASRKPLGSLAATRKSPGAPMATKKVLGAPTAGRGLPVPVGAGF